MDCYICNETKFRYKCPTCFIKYCSLNCWEIHKSTGCEKVCNEETNENVATRLENTLFPTDDTLSANDLAKLGQSNELKELLKDAHLREILLQVEKSFDPNTAFVNAMKKPVFEKFAQICLKIVDPDEVDKQELHIQENVAKTMTELQKLYKDKS